MSSPSQKNASYSACLNCRSLPLLGGPQAGGERKRRTRLVARQVDLDPERLRPRVDVARPIHPQVVAAYLEQRARRRSQLEREPLDLRPPVVLGRLDGA